jgi:hypothetical protein
MFAGVGQTTCCVPCRRRGFCTKGSCVLASLGLGNPVGRGLAEVSSWDSQHSIDICSLQTSNKQYMLVHYDNTWAFGYRNTRVVVPP